MAARMVPEPLCLALVGNCLSPACRDAAGLLLIRLGAATHPHGEIVVTIPIKMTRVETVIAENEADTYRVTFRVGHEHDAFEVSVRVPQLTAEEDVVSKARAMLHDLARQIAEATERRKS